MPAPHPREFRERAVELVRQGEKPVGELAKDLGISEFCVIGLLRLTLMRMVAQIG